MELAKYRDSSVDLLATDKTRYFAQPRPITVNYLMSEKNNATVQTYHSLENLAKNNMFAVKPWCFDRCNKELWAICIFSSIGHAHPARAMVL